MEIGPVQISSDDEEDVLTTPKTRKRKVEQDSNHFSSGKKRSIHLSEDEEDQPIRTKKDYALRKREVDLPRLNIRARVQNNRDKTLQGTSSSEEDYDSVSSFEEEKVQAQPKRARKSASRAMKKSDFVENDFKPQRRDSSGYEADDLRDFIAQDDE